MTFKAANGSVIACADPLGKIALLALGTRWPQSVAFADLFAVAREHAGVADADPAPQAAALADLLYRAVVDRQMEFHVAPPPLTTEISERREASLLARRQIESGPVVSNLRHARVVLNDPVARRFLVLVDGTRTADDLVRDLNAQLTATGGSDRHALLVEHQMRPLFVSREQVDENLRILARLALLIR